MKRKTNQIDYDSIPALVFFKDTQNRILRANRLAAELRGVTPEQMAGRPTEEFYPDEAAQYYADDLQVLHSGIAKRGIVEPCEVGGGKKIWIQTTKIPYIDDKGKTIGVIGFAQEITQLKAIEEELRQRTEELFRTSSELNHLAHVVSHDLQEPLRMVTIYLQLLEQRYKDNLDKEAKEFLKFAVDGGARLRRMINDLLEYSRAGKPLDSVQNVDLGAALDVAKHKLAAEIEDAKAQVTYGDLPTVSGNFLQIAAVFEHLLSNSIRFRGTDALHIDTRAELNKGEWVITVRDNGLGVPPGDQSRIFGLFQQLHERTAATGTGIGLSLCRRIVERHGGKIWVESTPGKGSAFRFTFPVQKT